MPYYGCGNSSGLSPDSLGLNLEENITTGSASVKL